MILRSRPREGRAERAAGRRGGTGRARKARDGKRTSSQPVRRWLEPSQTRPPAVTSGAGPENEMVLGQPGFRSVSAHRSAESAGRPEADSAAGMRPWRVLPRSPVAAAHVTRSCALGLRDPVDSGTLPSGVWRRSAPVRILDPEGLQRALARLAADRAGRRWGRTSPYASGSPARSGLPAGPTVSRRCRALRRRGHDGDGRRDARAKGDGGRVKSTCGKPKKAGWDDGFAGAAACLRKDAEAEEIQMRRRQAKCVRISQDAPAIPNQIEPAAQFVMFPKSTS